MAIRRTLPGKPLANDAPGVPHDTVGRTRAAIAASLASIERSADRVRDTLGILTRSQTRFDRVGAPFTDEDMMRTIDRWQAELDQREIEQEMLRTVMGQN